MEQSKEAMKLEIKDYKRRHFNTSIKTVMLFILLAMELAFIGIFAIKSGLAPNPIPDKESQVAVVNFNKEVTVDYVHQLMVAIDKEIEKDNVKEILIVFNSPGGSPSASEEMSEYLKDIQKKKPVSVYLESLAASGAYYIASAVRPIVANKNAIVGSIGVIMPHYSFGKLADTIGVKEDYLAAGKFKKPVSLLKELDAENKEYLMTNMLKPTYKNFVQSVADNRGMTYEKISEYAEGTIFIANDPRIKGILVDKISSYHQVKKDMRKKYGKDTIFYKIGEDKKGGLFPLNASIDINLANIKSSTLELK